MNKENTTNQMDHNLEKYFGIEKDKSLQAVKYATTDNTYFNEHAEMNDVNNE
ncbi:hypothetical protein ACFSCX_11060 [Bacillus salitolerans]|uniref:Uncharacterized protein n=1 Tax=Bacillus salitolerans TaxID=1437434 RepID=A0ABW4LQH2_9BACI